MRRLLLIALLIAGMGHAAYVEHYVTTTGTDTWTNSTSSGTPCSLATAFANCTAGERANIKTGAYSLGATTITNAGDETALSVYRGYDTAIGDLEGQGRNADTTLDTTDFPVITLTGAITAKAFVVFESLSFTGSLTSSLIAASAVGVSVISCDLLNSDTASNQNVRCITFGNGLTLANSDAECSGGNHGYVVAGGYTARFLGNRFTTTSNYACIFLTRGSVVNNAFIGGGSGANGMGIVWSATSQYGGCLTAGNTFYDLATCITFPAFAWDVSPVVMNNHATDSTKGIDNLYSGTASQTVIEINNRTRDITTDPRTTLGDGVLIGEVDTDTGGESTDYVNAAAGNLRLIEGAPGESAGMTDYEDIGAFQREPSAGGGTTIIVVED